MQLGVERELLVEPEQLGVVSHYHFPLSIFKNEIGLKIVVGLLSIQILFLFIMKRIAL
jgi:hypothetical protein